MKKILTLVCMVLLFVGCNAKKDVDTPQAQGEQQEKERINLTETTTYHQERTNKLWLKKQNHLRSIFTQLTGILNGF